ncbi:hypothetical protein MFFC18_37050 [Mariniblastus fucicola]|uniref:Uncharacterized protein n=1 Tax=Mariniblastus fucicola TaxID=980251 RepID=A0A5B9PMI9_9BACT|nr:hypothetical protein MFFC18_37050 [Mariniblastus fucicola]
MSILTSLEIECDRSLNRKLITRGCLLNQRFQAGNTVNQPTLRGSVHFQSRPNSNQCHHGHNGHDGTDTRVYSLAVEKIANPE